MYKNSSAPSDNTVLWHHLDTKHLDFRCDFRCDSNSTPGVLIEEIQYIYSGFMWCAWSARLELLHAHEQSCYMKIADNRTVLNVCVFDDWDWQAIIGILHILL